MFKTYKWRAIWLVLVWTLAWFGCKSVSNLVNVVFSTPLFRIPGFRNHPPSGNGLAQLLSKRSCSKLWHFSPSTWRPDIPCCKCNTWSLSNMYGFFWQGKNCLCFLRMLSHKFFPEHHYWVLLQSIRTLESLASHRQLWFCSRLSGDLPITIQIEDTKSCPANILTRERFGDS